MTFAATPALMAASAPAVSETWLPPRLAHLRPSPYARTPQVRRSRGNEHDREAGRERCPCQHDDRNAGSRGCADAGDQFTLIGHKWFTSAPMSDAFLTLAQAHDGSGVSCYLVPRILPDGTRNAGLRFLRLKDKIGDRSNASGEVEYSNAWGVQIGQSGKVRTIVEMVVHTRLDCTIGSAALMRQSAQLAAHHCAQRHAFGTRLADAPLMRSVLLDLAAETEAANALWPRLAAPLMRHDGTIRLRPPSAASPPPSASTLSASVRLAWCAKRWSAPWRQRLRRGFGDHGAAVPPGASQRYLGGERQRHRARCLARRAKGQERVSGLSRRAKQEPRGRLPDGCTSRGTAQHARRRGSGSGGGEEGQRQLEARARTLVDRMGVALQAATLIQHGHPAAAEAFCASRLPGRTISTPSGGCSYGALGADFGDAVAEAALLDRPMPCTDLQKS